MDITLKNNFGDLVKELKKLPSSVQDKIVKPLLRDAATGGRTAANREISKTYNFKSSEVRKSTTSYVTKQGNQHVGIVQSKSDRRFSNMIHFVKNAKAIERNRFSVTKSGKRKRVPNVLVEIRKGNRKQLGNTTFIGNQNRTVFKRLKGEWITSRKNGRRMERIKPVRTLSITTAFRSRKVTRKIIDRVNELLLSRFAHHSSRVLERWK